MESYLEILPEEIVNNILLCATHPVADIVREEIDKFLTDDDDLSEFSGLYFEQYFINHCSADKKYCDSCVYYYPRECICCPRCD